MSIIIRKHRPFVEGQAASVEYAPQKIFTACHTHRMAEKSDLVSGRDALLPEIPAKRPSFHPDVSPVPATHLFLSRLRLFRYSLRLRLDGDDISGYLSYVCIYFMHSLLLPGCLLF